MNLALLISQIQSLDGSLKHEASKAVNRLLTIRNWLIGYYIVEYEQRGEDRAKYGDGLLNTLAEKLDINGLGSRNLKLFKQLYLYYPSIVQTVSAQLQSAGNQSIEIWQTQSAALYFHIDAHAATSSLPGPEGSLHLFPDPGNGSFTCMLSSPVNEAAHIIITNIAGQKIKELTTTTNKETDIQLDAPPGLYLVNVVTESGKWSGKVVTGK